MRNLAARKARERARVRVSAVANDNVVPLAPPLELTSVDILPGAEPDDAPFAPPPADDILGVNECDEEEISDVEAEVPPPFDPPEFDEEPVFHAPEPTKVEVAPPVVEPATAIVETPKHRDRPLPAISIHACWERPESEALMRTLAADARFARTCMDISRGGIEGAIAKCAPDDCPDLFILDTKLQIAPLLASLDRLIEVMAPRSKIVVIGDVNDIGLLRGLAARRVCDYIVPPAKADDVARSLCALFADHDAAQVIAVVGARGGIGASTIARNIAWSIAERQRQNVALVDCDVSFGLAAFGFQHDVTASITDVLRAGDQSEAALMRAMAKQTPRLQLLSAPAQVEAADFSHETFDAMISQVRRTSTYVVLDLPHAWTPWVRGALRNADQIVLVAGADLASLRNADNMLKLLRSERDKVSAPVIVASMAGVPKRPEIPAKDFAEALCVRPAMTFAFEPELFVKAEEDGLMLHEAMPDAKAALQIDALASLLTGRDAHAQPEPRQRQARVKHPPVAPPTEVLELTVPAPAEIAPTPRRPRGARSGVVAVERPAPSPRRRSRGVVRAVLAALFLGLAGAWEVQQRDMAPDRPTPDSPRAFSV